MSKIFCPSDVWLEDTEHRCGLCEQCFENALKRHDYELRTKIIADIRVGLGKVQEFEYETHDEYRHFKYYYADKVLSLLTKIANEGK